MAFRSSSASPGSAAPPQGMLRFTVESAVLLAVAVTIFRAFFAEGYMISTGSMAPSLLGYHRQVCCPACALEFARGAAVEAAAGQANASTGQGALDSWTPVGTRCPNCGTAIDAEAIPRTEGDQLMVHKHHYDWRDPQRWEVVVFRNPELQTQAYVKRAAGLPGETIELRDGDVYADGELQRKPLAVQRSLRVPVDDHDHQPAVDDPDWQPRWRAMATPTTWQTDGPHFRFTPAAEANAATDIDWVQYHHWVRAGGRHLSHVPLAEWPHSVAEPGLIHCGFRFDPERHELEASGAMSHEELERWVERVPAGATEDALQALYLESHQPPLSDVCGYNHPDAATLSYPIRDLMLELTLTAHRRQGEFVLAMHDGSHELRCTLDLEAGTARLTADDKTEVHREAPLPEAMLQGEPAVLTMSQFDRQVLVAIDGELLFKPLLYAAEGDRPLLPRRPVRFGANGADLTVSQVRLDRDVYYTAPEGAATATYTLADDEFFMLGDNSPVSLDSRAWSHPAVPRSLLIGRPFVVHLPSRPLTLHWGERDMVLRVPDFSRVRYIR
jgi:signal peptidase I